MTSRARARSRCFVAAGAAAGASAAAGCGGATAAPPHAVNAIDPANEIAKSARHTPRMPLSPASSVAAAPRRWPSDTHRHASDLIAVRFGKPHRVIGARDDPLGPASCGGNRILGERSAGGDPSDLVAVAFGEPQRAVGAGGDAVGVAGA